jgi:hypothetical protein
MALRMDKRCKVCKKIRQEESKNRSKLIKRIYNSGAYVKGGESLRAISRDYTDYFEYQALYNHSKKHQAPSEEDLVQSRLYQVHKKDIQDKIKRMFTTEEVRNEIIEKGMEGLESGEIKLNANHLIQAAKHTDEKMLKEKDQSLALMRTIQAFQSGEVQYTLPDEE